MGFFDDLFNRSTERIENLQLGRFSDAYKPESHQKIWENALLAFESEKYSESFQLLLDFLSNPDQKNVSWQNEDGIISFKLVQGSKVVSGILDETRFRAEVKVAKAGELNIGLSRKLLERNYLLKYARFALDDEGHILLILDSYKLDASPNKLYQGLKEMATQADKLDDLILDEFSDLRPINTEHIIPRTAERRQHEFQYLNSELEKCFHEIENGKLNIDQFPGGLSFLLLALNYKLDFLLTPEGFLMDNLEQNHKAFFGNSGMEVGHRNNVFIKSFRRILERSEQEIESELYDVISTFGLPAPTPHETLVQLIKNELPNMAWYKENNHTAIALAIPSYIVGYSLFSYALPKPDMDLLRLFYEVLEPEFFQDKTFRSGEKISSRAVRKALEGIEDEYKALYPSLELDTAKIDFTSEVSFSESYLLMVKNINLNGGDH